MIIECRSLFYYEHSARSLRKIYIVFVFLDKDKIRSIVSNQAHMSDAFWQDFDNNINITKEILLPPQESNPIRSVSRRIIRQIKSILILEEDKERFIQIKKNISVALCEELVKEKKSLLHAQTLDKSFDYMRDFIVYFLKQKHNSDSWTLCYFKNYITQYFSPEISARINTITTNYCTGFMSEDIIKILGHEHKYLLDAFPFEKEIRRSEKDYKKWLSLFYASLDTWTQRNIETLKSFESETWDHLGRRMYYSLSNKYGKNLGNNLWKYIEPEQLKAKPFCPKIDEYSWEEVCSLVLQFFALCKDWTYGELMNNWSTIISPSLIKSWNISIYNILRRKYFISPLEIDWETFKSDFSEDLKMNKLIFEYQSYYNVRNVRDKLHQFIRDLKTKGINKRHSSLLQELRPGLYSYLKQNFRHEGFIDWLSILILFFDTETLQNFPFLYRRKKVLLSNKEWYTTKKDLDYLFDNRDIIGLSPLNPEEILIQKEFHDQLFDIIDQIPKHHKETIDNFLAWNIDTNNIQFQEAISHIKNLL